MTAKAFSGLAAVYIGSNAILLFARFVIDQHLSQYLYTYIILCTPITEKVTCKRLQDLGGCLGHKKM